MCYRLFAVLTVCAAGFFTTPDHVLAADDDIVGPAADETLIYVIRLKRRTAGLLGDWIAINDQTVARVKHKKHAVIRTKAGAITLSLAMQGFVDGAIALDDRPGETVYLRFRVGDWLLTEVDAAEATNLLKKSKLMDPIEEVLPNKERVAALLNISRIGFDLTRPATADVVPDGEHAVITILRRDDGEDLEFGIWGEHGFLGTLKTNEGVKIRVPAGEHFFLAGYNGKSLLKAQVEAGKSYFAWLDFGKMISRVRLTPITQSDSKALERWLDDVSWVEADPQAITPRVQERVDIVTEFVRSAGQRAESGEADFHLLSSAHAF